MFRNFFLFLSTHAGLRKWMETSSTARKLTSRFIAGVTLEEELRACQALERAGMLSILDRLGENVTTEREAVEAKDAYVEAVAAAHALGLPSTVAVKLTNFGLDFSEPLCLDLFRAVVAAAQQASTRVEVDMESSLYTERTLRIVEQAASEFPSSIRVVIQAYLYRSEADIRRMNELGVPVRLCKGAYNEPPSIAMPNKRDVDRSYLVLAKELLDHGADPALATHDEKMIGGVLRHVHERSVAKDSFEFQMLYGIRRDLQDRLAREGYRVRLYVPYGTTWYPYFMRRLAERPANALFVLRNLLH